MQLILSIDSDPRRSEQLATLVGARFTVELVQATSAGEGLHALRDRVPDLILTAPLLSPFDDGVLDEYLRDLGSAATHIQTVRIPMLSTGPRKKSAATRLFSLGRKKKPASAAAPDGCDPKVFADEIAHYLTRSLEQRAASGKTVADRKPYPAAESFVQPVDEWAPPEALLQEFRAPVVETPKPIAATPAIEQTYVPGSILDLRVPIVRAPEPIQVVEPEPEVLVEDVEPVSQDFIELEPPAFVEPQWAACVEPERPVIVESQVPAIVAPVASANAPQAANAPKAVSAPMAPATQTGTSSSFEAALAAIRAAWVTPEDTKTVAQPAAVAEPPVAPSSGPATVGPRPLAGSGEVDLTNEIDALEDVGGVDGPAPGANEGSSPDESKTSTERRTVDKFRKRPEKATGRKLRGPDGRGESGVFDPNQCGFSALVNKLDEVTEDEVTVRATPTVR